MVEETNQADTDKSQEIEELKRYLASAEESLEAAKRALGRLTSDISPRVGKTSFDTGKLETPTIKGDGKVVEGTFDGESMLGPDGSIYPVSANYASKSKLIEGDHLKLTIAEDGSFIFKQTGPAPRKKIIGTLSLENNAYHVLAEGKTYNVLFASVTYYKAKSGDRVTIIVPEQTPSDWASLDNVIHNVTQSPEPEENILLDDQLVTSAEPKDISASPEPERAVGVESTPAESPPPVPNFPNEPQENQTLPAETPVLAQDTSAPPQANSDFPSASPEPLNSDQNPPIDNSQALASELNI